MVSVHRVSTRCSNITAYDSWAYLRTPCIILLDPLFCIFFYRTSYYQCSWAAHFFAFSPWLWWCRGTWTHLNKTIRYFFLALLFPPNSRSKRTCGSECIQLPLLLLLSFSCWWQVHCRGAWPWWEALCNLHTKIFAMDSALERSWSCCALVAYFSVLLRGPRVSRLCCSASGTADIPSPQAANTPFHDPRINPLVLKGRCIL